MCNKKCDDESAYRPNMVLSGDYAEEKGWEKKLIKLKMIKHIEQKVVESV